MKTTRIITFALVLAAIFSACNKEPDRGTPIQLDLKSQQLVEADNAFGLNLFRSISADPKSPANFMISPLSISMALSMAWNGAETETRDEMAEAMRVQDFDRDDVNQIYLDLIKALTSNDRKVTMEIANSIWYRKGYHVEADFLNVNRTYYDAEVEEADFSDPATLDRINGWVNDKTHEKIPKIIDEIPTEMVMYLINALYFKGTWQQEFNPESTQKMGFLVAPEEYTEVDMMGREDTLNYFRNETFSAIELPYGDGNFNMTILLPHLEKNINDVVDQLSADNWKQWQKAFSKTGPIDIRLPKFKIEYEIVLNQLLQQMGMQLAFTPAADFSSINPARNLYISFVKHKTFVEVDEEGTEAAAVTIIGFEVTSINPNELQKINFHCDRPFLFVITEKSTGTIIFMGKVGNPNAKNE
jgi:serine protease inhibitor